MPPRIDLSIADLSELPLTYEATIPEHYLDLMGHMNVMWYTFLFDRAVVGTFELIGMTPQFMESHQTGGFALESHICYLSEVRVGQTVKLYTRLAGRSDKRFHLLHLMYNDSKQKLAATFEVVGACIDMRTRRMTTWPAQVASKLDELIAQHARLKWSPPLCGSMQP